MEKKEDTKKETLKNSEETENKEIVIPKEPPKTSKKVAKETDEKKESAEKSPDIQEKEPKKSEEKLQKTSQSKKKAILKDREISFKTFLLSHLGILLAGLAFIGFFYFLVGDRYDGLNVERYDPVTKEPSSFSLDINNLDDNLLTFDENIVISGKTDPNTTVLITSNETDLGLESDSKGNFTKVINLAEGPNLVTVTAFDSKGNVKTINRSVYYSKESLEEEKDNEKN